MSYSDIDKLYEIYLNEYILDAEDYFLSYYHKPNFIKSLENYIAEQTQNISNYYVSNIDANKKVDNIVEQITSAFEIFLNPINTFLIDFIYKDSNQDDYKYDVFHEDVKPHDLFSMSMKFMEDAVEKYSSNEEDFKKVKVLIEYIKKEKLIKKLYNDDSWKHINFKELIANLYDIAKDKSVFEGVYDKTDDNKETLFGRVKENCRNISLIPFDKYRAQLNTSKQHRVQYGKLIFCKNLLSFYKTGIMVEKDGFIDCSSDFSERIKMKDKFKRLYSSKFDETKFRKHQTNFICKPEIYSASMEIDAKKSVNFGDRLIMGYLLSANTSTLKAFNHKIQYLIHINIEDVNNPCSNYEIQLNIVPQGKFSNRLQLVRLDNWDSEQPHRNIAKKLKTRTHIHLYNEFDLIRGKVDGAYDIAYNFNNNSTNFETALTTFLDILDFDEDLRNEIYSSTIDAINNNKKTSENNCSND